MSELVMLISRARSSNFWIRSPYVTSIDRTISCQYDVNTRLPNSLKDRSGPPIIFIRFAISYASEISRRPIPRFWYGRSTAMQERMLCVSGWSNYREK
jgi:hypothetical protein